VNLIHEHTHVHGDVVHSHDHEAGHHEDPDPSVGAG